MDSRLNVQPGRMSALISAVALSVGLALSGCRSADSLDDAGASVVAKADPTSAPTPMASEAIKTFPAPIQQYYRDHPEKVSELEPVLQNIQEDPDLVYLGKSLLMGLLKPQKGFNPLGYIYENPEEFHRDVISPPSEFDRLPPHYKDTLKEVQSWSHEELRWHMQDLLQRYRNEDEWWKFLYNSVMSPLVNPHNFPQIIFVFEEWRVAGIRVDGATAWLAYEVEEENTSSYRRESWEHVYVRFAGWIDKFSARRREVVRRLLIEVLQYDPSSISKYFQPETPEKAEEGPIDY